MEQIALPVKDAYIIQHPRHFDKRGFLEELFNIEKYPQTITSFFPVLQVTSATSAKNVLRGLHYSPYSKLLSVISGSLYDVVVDLRPDSSTYLRWAGVHLTEENCRQLFVPPYCGHGYLSLQDDTTVVYCQGGCFQPANDFGINPLDALVNVKWLLSDVLPEFILSEKDKGAKLWKQITPETRNVVDRRPRILIIGENSQTGLALRETLTGRGCEVYGTSNTIDHANTMKLDLSSPNDGKLDRIKIVLDAVRPDTVVVCSAFSHVDGCETTPEKSQRINIDGTFRLVQECKVVRARVVFLSSNYVFGEQTYKSPKDNLIADNGLMEHSPTEPLNIYAQHKLQTENNIFQLDNTAVVVRVSNVYGPSVNGRKNNFVYQMFRAMTNHKKYICSTSEMVVPTYTYDIANAITLLIEHGKSGLYHVCGPEAFTKYEWAMRVAEGLKLSPTPIDKIDGQLPSPAKRPQGAVMSTKKIRTAFPELKFSTFVKGLQHWRNTSPDDFH